MNEELQKYLQCFKQLKRGTTKYGPAPHKPILLLSVLQNFENQKNLNNQIFITPELILLFKSNWSNLVASQHVCNFALPYFYLRGEKFWKLQPKPGFEALLSVRESITSLTALNEVVDYAYLSPDLFNLIKESKTNQLLQQFILDEYFPKSKLTYSFSSEKQQNLFEELEGKILYEKASEYRAEIKSLLLQKNEEEIFLRGSLFKREVPKIYNFTCCISGMKIDSTFSTTMVDACHIIPFSEGYDDTITNGIALCPNLHRAFDRGLIAVDESYRVLVSDYFKEGESSYSIRKFAGRQILLPNRSEFNPSLQNFRWHKANTFKA